METSSVINLVLFLVTAITVVAAKRIKKKKEKMITDVFYTVLQSIIEDETLSKRDRVTKTHELCRMTKGVQSAAVYQTINLLHQNKYFNYED